MYHRKGEARDVAILDPQPEVYDVMMVVVVV